MGKITLTAVLLLVITTAKSTLANTCFPGDANGDGQVSSADYVIWFNNYDQTTTNGCVDGDFSGDEIVNGIDFVEWHDNYNQSSSSPTPSAKPTPVQTSCLNQTGSLVTLSGIQSKRYDTRSNKLAQNTKVDARNASWIAQWPVQDSFNYPVVIAGEPNICFSGGLIQGNYPEEIGSDANATWEFMHDTSAMEISSSDIIIENIRIDNYGDGIGLDKGTSDNFLIKGVYLSHIRDDCVENDWLLNGFVDDSLFDGCLSAFSARTYADQNPDPGDGSNNIWTVQNSLIRLEAMRGVYKNRGTIPGHDGFFKWDGAGISPKLSLHNNIFRADQDANNVGLGIPPGKLASCSNNVVVWLGEGSYPDPLPGTFDGHACFTITNDKSVWDDAVADWKSSHQL